MSDSADVPGFWSVSDMTIADLAERFPDPKVEGGVLATSEPAPTVWLCAGCHHTFDSRYHDFMACFDGHGARVFCDPCYEQERIKEPWSFGARNARWNADELRAMEALKPQVTPADGRMVRPEASVELVPLATKKPWIYSFDEPGYEQPPIKHFSNLSRYSPEAMPRKPEFVHLPHQRAGFDFHSREQDRLHIKQLERVLERQTAEMVNMYGRMPNPPRMMQVTPGMWTDETVRADKARIAALEAENATLQEQVAGRGRLGVLYNKRRALEQERDRYIEINCRLGAENEALRDRVHDLARDKKALIDQSPRYDPFLRPGISIEGAGFDAHLVWWPDELHVPLFHGEQGSRTLHPVRLSAGWEHCPCITTGASAMADDTGPKADYHGPNKETDPTYPAHKAVHDAAEHLLGGRVTNPKARAGLREALDKADATPAAPSDGKSTHATPTGKAFQLVAPDGIMGMVRP